MNNLLFLLFISLFIVSCQNTKDNTESNSDNNELQEEQGKEAPDKIMHLQITGMMCEMGCGGTIRKNLKNDLAVTKVEFDFVPNQPQQTCRVYYDSKKHSETAVTNLIEELNDQQFKVSLDSITSTSR